MSHREISNVRTIYNQNLLDLLYQAHTTHRNHHNVGEVQRCKLLSIKTGGCPEDCSYCPQSAHYKTNTTRHGLLSLAEVKKAVTEAKLSGAQRFCMGAAWREVKDGPEFERVLDMIRAVKEQGLEACVTLGLLGSAQAQRLKEAGLDAYNHNLDASREFYSQIISTRTYEDRLKTLSTAREAGIQICSGGIIGMGESIEDRLKMLTELASFDPQPESVPINLLIPVKGTPLEKAKSVDSLELVRIIAVARILLPKSRLRLSAGRTTMSQETQTLAFFAGANSIFIGEKLLTRENPSLADDGILLKNIGELKDDAGIS